MLLLRLSVLPEPGTIIGQVGSSFFPWKTRRNAPWPEPWWRSPECTCRSGNSGPGVSLPGGFLSTISPMNTLPTSNARDSRVADWVSSCGSSTWPNGMGRTACSIRCELAPGGARHCGSPNRGVGHSTVMIANRRKRTLDGSVGSAPTWCQTAGLELSGRPE